MKPRQPLSIQIRYVTLAVRFTVFAFLLWQIRSTEGVLRGHLVPLYLPESIAALHVLICSLLVFSMAGSKPAAAAAGAVDLAVGWFFLIAYPGDLSFSIPLFLATYTAGAISWPAAFSTAVLGSGVLLAQNLTVQGANITTLLHPAWLFGLALNFLISAIALFKAESSRLQEDINTLVKLIETGQQFGANLTPEKLFQMNMILAKELFSARLAAVYMKDADGLMAVAAVEAPEANVLRNFNPKSDASMLNEVLSSKSAHLIDDLLVVSADQEQVLPRSKNYRAGMIAPLMLAGEVVGLLLVSGKFPQMYDGESLKLIKVLAGQTALALRNMQLHERTQALAVTDSVSGLYTYGYMLEALEREFRRCKSANLPISACLLDVDQFKDINETHGHPGGDSLLRQVATIVKTMTRSSDIVCRHGADKFMILFPETARLGAVMVAERIRQAVEMYEFVLGSKVVQVTLSAGVSNFPEDSLDQKTLLDNANLALLLAKDQGKNKVTYPG